MPTTATHVWRPSSARVLLLDSFVPVPRGSVAVALPPLSWPAKDPADVLDYQFDISAALVGNDGDAIASLDVTISPDAPGDLTVTASSADGAAAVLWLAGGQSGTTYTVTLVIGTLNGRAVQRSVLLPVLALSTPAAGVADLTDATGAPVTDQNGNPLVLAPAAP
jgi:hypothetical protein